MDGREDASITLIVPVYNVERYLEQCLDSVVNQSVPFEEVILVNDGSTDSSLSICERYADKHTYMKVIDQENKGQSAARNRGLRHAHSGYVMFLDSDDYLRTDTVERLKKQLREDRYDAIYFDADTCCEMESGWTGRNIYDRGNCGLDKIKQSGWEYFSRCYPQDYVVHVGMAIYQKRAIDDAALAFPEGMYYEDNYFSFLFLKSAKAVTHISEKLYQRRYRENSTTTTFSERHFRDYMKVSRLIWEEVCAGEWRNRPERRGLLLTFAGGYCSMVLKFHQKCIDEKVPLSIDTKKFFHETIADYFTVLEKWNFNTLVHNGAVDDLPVLISQLKILHNIYQLQITLGLDLDAMIYGIVQKQKRLYYGLLNELPFGREDYVVGIYGAGKHTDGLMALYEKLIGKIKCKLVFIDSKRSSGMYQGRQFVYYKEMVDCNLDLIVVSSFLYEQEMISNIMSVQPNAAIHTFYSEMGGDVFSDNEVILRFC